MAESGQALKISLHQYSVSIILVLAYCLLLHPTTVLAWTSQGFFEDHSTWLATDIVVVDGEGMIIEVWSGDQRKGTTIPLKSLELSITQEHEPTSYYYRNDGGQLRHHFAAAPDPLVGSRMILFLRRNEADTKDGVLWKPAYPSSGSMKYSTIWIADDTLWCWRGQWLKSSQLEPLYSGVKKKQRQTQTLTAFKKYVQRILEIRASFRKVARTRDPAARAEKLVDFVRSESSDCEQEALSLLTDCGKAALPSFRSLVFDPDHLGRQGGILRALVNGCEEDAKPLLIDIVRDEVKYWKKAGAQLESGWGHGPSNRPEAMHFWRLDYTLHHLVKMLLSRKDEKLVMELQAIMDKVANREAKGTPLDSSNDDYRMKKIIIKILQGHGTTTEPRDAQGRTALLAAAAVNDYDTVAKLLAAGADARVRGTWKDEGPSPHNTPTQSTPLHWAVHHGNLRMVKLLLESGAGLEIEDGRNWTPVFWAMHSNIDAEVLQFLVDQGAKLNVVDSSPLIMAAYSEDPTKLRILLKAGMDPLARTSSGSAIHTASHKEVLVSLIDAISDINVRDERGNTVLGTEASSKCRPEVIQLLLDRGADDLDPLQGGRTNNDRVIRKFDDQVRFCFFLVGMPNERSGEQYSEYYDAFLHYIITRTHCRFEVV